MMMYMLADNSDRIIIGTGILLVLTVVISNYFGLGRIIVTIDDLGVEIATSKDNYTLGESFTAKVYLVNAFSRDVSMEPLHSVLIQGNSVNDPTPAKMTVDINSDGRRHIPAESKALFLDLPFTPKYPGEFRITCLGVQKTVLILEPKPSIGTKTWDIGDLLDPELALSHGFKGYINASYVSEMPARVIVSPGKIVNYTIRLELIPHVPEFMETEVLLAPENERAQFGILSSGANLNDYIHYSPNGTILLKVDEPRNVTMILSVPEGLAGISEYPGNLFGIGMWADVPIASAYGAGLRRITRDEG